MNDEILIAYLLSEASPQQIVQVEAWLAAEPDGQLQLERFKKTWEASRNLDDDYVPDAAASLERLKQKMSPGSGDKQIRRNYSWLKAAAAAIVLVGAAWLFFKEQNPEQLQVRAISDVKTVRLSDGSVVTLNKHSRLNYPGGFKGDQRKVVLSEGEAFFKVAPDKTKPFIINTNGTTIRVVGTSFNVKNKFKDVEVIVETGIVQVTRNGNTVLLKPGEKVWVKSNEIFRKEKNPDKLYNYYRSKVFVANNTPLWRMVEVLNEAYNCKIVIGRKDLSDLPLNTTFNDESLDDILAIISRTFGATIEKKQGQIVIK